MPNSWMSMIALLLVPVLGLQGQVQKAPPWSKGANDPAMNKGYEFWVPDIDNVPICTVTLPMRNWCCLLAGTSSLCCRN
jgi:hypothetical protein